MPYILTTKRRSRVAMHCGAMRTDSRRAVATLDEARGLVKDEWLKHARRPTPLQVAIETYLPESGGTVGPLPDGAVIEVEQVGLARLRVLIGGEGFIEPTNLIDAFNADPASTTEAAT